MISNAEKAEGVEQARKLFAQQCDFVVAAAAPDHFPVRSVPEVAFIGRSNVGKSSLINALTNRKTLARASNTPGRTQQIIFFNLAKRLVLVDLPGYGHVEAPHMKKDQWNNLVQYYLQKRTILRCVLLLIDGRHGILANDITMMKFLDRAAASYKIVMTKADQVRPAEREQRIKQAEAMLAKHPAAKPKLLMTSADKDLGLEDLRVFLMDYAAPKAD
jgi:GTP-binding protein